MDVAYLLNIPLHDTKVIFQSCRYFTQYETLTCIIQYWLIIASYLFKDTVRKPSEAQYINIHDTASGVAVHHVQLGLHSELIRHYNQVVPVRILHCLGNDVFI